MTPEQHARVSIDALLSAAGWHVCHMANANIHAARGVALREFPLNPGYGFADYLLYIDGKAAGVIEAKKQGSTLTGVEVQSARYAQGLPKSLPAWVRPLPFCYESTGIETHFTQGLDPEPRARAVFAFHRPETLATFLKDLPAQDWVTGAAIYTRADATSTLPATTNEVAASNAFNLIATNAYTTSTRTLLGRIKALPPLMEDGLWSAQVTAIQNLEKSLKANKPRALIQMATGSGKTYTAISFIYRLIKFGGAKRVLFLVDRGNLGRQTKKEFDQYTSPYNNFKFGEEFIVQHLQSNQLDTTARVTICTIQRLFSMLKGRELAAEDDEQSVDGLGNLFKQPDPIGYNPAFPIETFDVIVTDEAHRSIYNLWRQVLEYFDAYLIGLTATPSKQTFGFFNQNLVMEYGHPQAVADGVNVNYDVYRIRTQVSEHGSQIEAGFSVGYRDRLTRQTRWQELDEDMAYDADALDRAVQTPDQIRTIVRTFRDKLPLDIFPGRTEVPKTLVFAKDDTHAGINLDKALFVSEAKAEELSRYRLKTGDLLFSRMASVGRAGLVPKWLEGALFNYHIMRLRLDESRIDTRLFIHYVRGAPQVRDYLKAVNHGATRDGINTEQLLGLPVAVPPIGEQREIVAEIEKQFSRLDEAVANLQRVKANLKRYKASVLKDAVEGRLVPTEAELARREGRGFETGEQLLQRILEARRINWKGKGKYKEPAPLSTERLVELPSGWVWAAVEMLCEQIVDCPHSTARFQDDGFPCIDTTWMTTEGLVKERARYVDQATYQDRISRLEPCAGDIVFAREGTIGTAILIPGQMTPCLGQRVMLLRSSAGFSSGLLMHILHSEVVKSQYRAQALGSTVAHINVGDVKRFAIPVPPLKEQHRILAEVDRRLSLIRGVEVEVDSNLARAKSLRQAVLMKCFSY